MTLSTVEKIRLRTSDKATITREVANSDGISIYFRLDHHPVATSPALEVRVNSVLQTVGVNYTVNTDQGIVTFTVAPAVNADVEFTYYWMIFTDAEIEDFYDEAGGSLALASAKVLLAIAADASKVAERQAMAGGGGLGSVTTDTSVTSRELRATAAAILEMEAQAGETIPAEGLTEVLWTEFQYQSSTEQRILRGS